MPKLTSVDRRRFLGTPPRSRLRRHPFARSGALFAPSGDAAAVKAVGGVSFPRRSRGGTVNEFRSLFGDG